MGLLPSAPLARRNEEGWKGAVRAHRAFGDKGGYVNPIRCKTKLSTAFAEGWPTLLW